jgi:UDP-glucose 4-epimerase
MKNEKIFITGGAGFLGKNIIKRFYNDNDITVYSRDESKHYFIKKEFPNVNFIIGDVRNYELMKNSSKNHTIGIFAASLKQIEACDLNAEEASKIIIDGAFNSKKISIENNFKSACFISSDKSRSATTIYGAMKYVAGESFIVHSSKYSTNLTTVIYGNVLNSTGSIIPLIWHSINNNLELNLYNPDMTRFLITVEKAVELINKSFKYKEVNIIPNLKSFLIKDLFEIYSEIFNLKYKITTPRTGEKIHEIMASNEEIRRMEYISEDNLYIMHPSIEINKLKFENNEYSSKNVQISKTELYNFLKNNNFYKP